MRGVVVAIISSLLSAGCSVFGVRNEQMPSYTVEKTLGSGDSRVELRRYGPRLAAEVLVAGSETDARSKGFKILAGYIFGGNTTKTSIEMTAPVAQSQSSTSQSIDMTAPVAQSKTADGNWRIRFFMPAKFTRETLPHPNDGAVEIVTVPPQTIAALRYSGSIGTQAVHDAEARLLRTVTAAGLHPAGAPFSWFYDPPWTLPPLRRNEAAVLVQPG